MTETISVAEAAKIARRSPQTIRRWCRNGEVRATRIPQLGGDWFINRTDFETRLGIKEGE